MQTVASIQGLCRFVQRWKQERMRIGLVPTMGYLHEGHISLVHKARQSVGGQGKVVVSIFVNPTQFAPTEDLAKYPRDLKRDQAMCREAGVDLVFAPADRQMYPADQREGYSTFVVEESLSRKMEGQSRTTHFRGVTTVVAKLFNLVQPDVAVFGAKDWQQAAVLQRMVHDLNFPIKMIIAPTVREADGLAMSSRNKYLSPAERVQATILYQALLLARARIRAASGSLDAHQIKQTLVQLIKRQPAARVDYIELFDPHSLEPVIEAHRGTRLALAVYFGSTRLIDNIAL